MMRATERRVDRCKRPSASEGAATTGLRGRERNDGLRGRERNDGLRGLERNDGLRDRETQ